MNRKLIKIIGIALLGISIFSFMANGQAWSFVIQQPTIQKWIKNEIDAYYADHKTVRYEIEYIKCPTRIQCPTENITYTISNKMNKWRGNVVFTVRIYSADNGKILKTFTAQARIKTFEKVVIARRTINKGDSLRDADMLVAEMETSKFRDDFFHSPEELKGKIAVQTIRKNRIIYSRYVKNVPIIKKGERIVLMYNQPPLVIKVFAIALQDGDSGAWIWVRNLQSNKRLKAKVVSAGIAEVE